MKKFLSVTGAILLIIPIYLLVLWIHACNLEPDFPRSVELYNSWLPGVLRGQYTTSLVGFGCSALAIFLNVFEFRKKTKAFKWFSLVIIFLAAPLAFLNLWSVM